MPCKRLTSSLEASTNCCADGHHIGLGTADDGAPCTVHPAEASVLLSASLAGCVSDEPPVLEVTASETDVVVVESYQNGVLAENIRGNGHSISPELNLP